MPPSVAPAIAVAVLAGIGPVPAPAPPRATEPPPPEVTATYLGLNGGANFSLRWDGRGSHVRHVGALAWAVPADVGTVGFDRQFTAICGEALVGVVAGQTYRFEARPAARPDGFELPDTD
ncbi:MAG: hypothetical protein K2X82_18300, partial [Gemmataceae bacterium]|nr:hypothetical protein [Gemmataceae bacterium]